jgi:hypothetical protein
MTNQITEHRTLTTRCLRLAKDCAGSANELEGIGVDIAASAQSLDEIFHLNEQTSRIKLYAPRLRPPSHYRTGKSK